MFHFVFTCSLLLNPSCDHAGLSTWPISKSLFDNAWVLSMAISRRIHFAILPLSSRASGDPLFVFALFQIGTWHLRSPALASSVCITYGLAGTDWVALSPCPTHHPHLLPSVVLSLAHANRRIGEENLLLLAPITKSSPPGEIGILALPPPGKQARWIPTLAASKKAVHHENREG